jgi:hypothetical protein
MELLASVGPRPRQGRYHLSFRLQTEVLRFGEESWGLTAEYVLNFRLQMGDASATEEHTTLKKQLKIGLCEQVRVN